MCQGLCGRSYLIDFKLVLLLLMGSTSVRLLAKVLLNLIGLAEASIARMAAILGICYSLTKLIRHLVSEVLLQHVHHFRLYYLVSCLLHVELGIWWHHI